MRKVNKTKKAKMKVVKPTKNPSVKGSGRGRTRGSFQFGMVSLDILSSIKGQIPIPLRWASIMGIENLKPVSTKQILESVQPIVEIAPAVTVTDLDA